MFCECTVVGPWKNVFRAIIRNNRVKHEMWKLGEDHAANHIILRSVVKNWFNPVNHSCNKVWAERNREGWGNREEDEDEEEDLGGEEGGSSNASNTELRKDASRRAQLRALKIATVGTAV
jgi:hypothetical protein